MLSEALIGELAAQLYESERTRVQVEHFSKRHPEITIEDGYRISRAWVAMQRADGRRVIGRQGQAPDIDGAQTIGGQAIGVGDEHVGGRAEYLQGALERGGRDAGHLVEDGARGPAQAGIAADPAGEGGDAFGRAVVQDHARLPYVEFGVAIMRNARRIRSGDLDHRYAIAGRGNLRCALRGDAARRRRRAGRREHGQRH
ncbi:hypothetical protein AZ14_0657, partial [Bordetella bronchiseptica 980]